MVEPVFLNAEPISIDNEGSHKSLMQIKNLLDDPKHTRIREHGMFFEKSASLNKAFHTLVAIVECQKYSVVFL